MNAPDPRSLPRDFEYECWPISKARHHLSRGSDHGEVLVILRRRPSAKGDEFYISRGKPDDSCYVSQMESIQFIDWTKRDPTSKRPPEAFITLAGGIDLRVPASRKLYICLSREQAELVVARRKQRESENKMLDRLFKV